VFDPPQCSCSRIKIPVLESIVNPLFVIALLFIVLTILEYDTRTLLVTVSTVLLSVAFVIGSTLSKYIEGIFFIAVRRPYDIGDRISIVSATEAAKDIGSMDTWIVVRMISRIHYSFDTTADYRFFHRSPGRYRFDDNYIETFKHQ
jgi:small-conductance mechanosensitive channel